MREMSTEWAGHSGLRDKEKSEFLYLMAPEFMSDWTAIKVQSIDVSGPRG